MHHEAKEPTCTEVGWDAYDECSREDYTSKVEKSALGHDYVKTETKAPTCTDTGMYEHVCSRCGHTKYETIAELGHELEHHEAKDPTCTEIGWSAYDTCTRCEYTTYNELAKLGHNYLLSRVDDEYHGLVCSRCKTAIDKELHCFLDYKCETCGTWGKGPAGGYVFYDCDADNDSSVNDGRGEDNLMSSECGWRYLEAAPADLRLVNGVPTVDSTSDGYSNGTESFVFGCYREFSDGSLLYVNGKTSNDGDCTRTGIGEGKRNTKLLVDAMGSAAYEYSSGNATTSNYAARLCNELSYENEEEVAFEDWFLPSRDELNLMYVNLAKNKLGSFANNFYWSSSEGQHASCAWSQRLTSGYQLDYGRFLYRVRPVRAFNPI